MATSGREMFNGYGPRYGQYRCGMPQADQKGLWLGQDRGDTSHDERRAQRYQCEAKERFTFACPDSGSERCDGRSVSGLGGGLELVD